ncbi:MAG: hypothetical protein R3A80_13925 [Bdellovibrionota bacterium]
MRFFFIFLSAYTSLGHCICLDALRAEILSDQDRQGILTHAFVASDKGGQEALLALRATPREAPFDFDLSNTHDLSEKLFDAKDLSTDALRLQLQNISQYEFMLLSLRTGDNVIFDGEVFKLGDFLGRGNTTHIWSLANDPDKVIRLPFLVGALRRPGFEGVHTRNEFMIGTYNALINSKNSPVVYAHDEYYFSESRIMRYMIVQRVNGSETGADYIRSLSNGVIDPESQRSSFLKSALDDVFNSEASAKLKALIEAMRSDNLFYPDSEIYAKNNPHHLGWVDMRFHMWPSGILAPSRQYVWDVQLERWFLVDGN